MAGFGDVLGWAKHQVASRVPKADLDQRDPDYIREQLPGPGCWRRCTSVPTSAASTGSQPKARCCWSATTAAATSHPTRSCSRWRSARTSASSGRSTNSRTTSWCRCPAWGRCASSAPSRPTTKTPGWHWNPGPRCWCIPGGDYEVFRPSWERHKVDFGGRKGYVKLAREAGVPIVPVASVGGQEAALFLDRGQWLAKLLMVDKLAAPEERADLAGPPWGLAISDMVPRLPAADEDRDRGAGPDRRRRRRRRSSTKRSRPACRPAWTALAAERRFPVIG